MTFPHPDGLRVRRLLAVVAHPDDETFGCGSTLLLAADDGIVTGVACATRGELGEPAPGTVVAPGGLGETRERELHEAARLLGVAEVRLLGLVDSGMDGDPAPGSLVATSPDRLAAAVADAVDAFAPDLLLTLDATDGHRDHVAVREAVRAVAAERGLPVYLQCLSRSLLQRWADHMATVRPDLPYLQMDELGTPDEEVDLVVDSGALLERRRAAMAAHGSQVSPFEALPDDLAEEMLTREHLRLLT